VQCLTSPPTQYRLYGRRFLQIKRPNQQYQSTEGSYKKQMQSQVTLTHWHLLLPYGYSYKASCARPG